MKVYIYILFLNILNFSECEDSLQLDEIEPSTNLSTTIEALSKSQKDCKYYNSKLMFLIKDISEADSLRVRITMIEGLDFLTSSSQKNIKGFFEADGHTVLVVSDSLKNLYIKTGRKKKFTYNKDFEAYPSDYSLWVYEIKEGQLNLLESYKIHCN
ncbi:hypothetical protein [Marivirga lumbricoides]